MLLEEALVAYLLTKPAVTDLVGDRIVPQKASQGETYPRIIYRRVSGRSGQHLGGASGECNARIELKCQALAYGDPRRLAEAVRNAMDGFRGQWDDVQVTGCTQENDVDRYTPLSTAGDAGVHEAICDYLIQHKVALPTH